MYVSVYMSNNFIVATTYDICSNWETVYNYIHKVIAVNTKYCPIAYVHSVLGEVFVRSDQPKYPRTMLDGRPYVQLVWIMADSRTSLCTLLSISIHTYMYQYLRISRVCTQKLARPSLLYRN